MTRNSKPKFPHAAINLALGLQHHGTTQIWIGGLLYVHDLAFMSTCPRELQAMLHVCEEWSLQNRMQINTQKTKVMAFFETPSLQKARGGQHQHGPTLPPFHIHAPFQTSSPCSYLITEVLQFEYLGLILEPKLTMHLATTEAIRRATHGQFVTQAVSYSLRYHKKRSHLTPSQNLGPHPNTKPGNLLYYLISSRICAISRVLLMLRNSRLASTSLLLALSMSMVIIQPYQRTLVSPPLP